MIDILKSIADENRFKIIKLLAKKSFCVCEIEEKLNLPQNLVSHHLSSLKEADLVKKCHCGKNNYYSLNEKTLNMVIKELIKIGENNEN